MNEVFLSLTVCERKETMNKKLPALKIQRLVQPAMRPVRWFRRTRKRNKVLTIIGIVLIVFFILGQVRGSDKKPQYITQPVEKRNILQIVSETGNISSGARTDVYSPATGIVEEVYVHNSDKVKVGEQLFKVRSTATEQEKAAALATYLSAKNTLDTANATLFTLQSQLFVANQAFVNDKGTDNPSDTDKADPVYVEENASWLAAEANYKKQQSVISQAQAALTNASLAYQATQNTTVKATADGTVTNAAVQIGEVVIAKGTTATAVSPVLIILSDISTPGVSVALNEVDIPKVKAGETVKITLDAFPGKTFTGRVTSVDGVGTNTAGVVTYNVSISLQTNDPGVRPGMTANVDIAVDKALGVLSVPNSAIKPYKGKKAVQVIDPKTKMARYIPVVIGIKSPERTEIKSGVSVGTKVITGTKNGAGSTGGGPFGG